LSQFLDDDGVICSSLSAVSRDAFDGLNDAVDCRHPIDHSAVFKGAHRQRRRRRVGERNGGGERGVFKRGVSDGVDGSE
jgi:hypothetical protein